MGYAILYYITLPFVLLGPVFKTIKKVGFHCLLALAYIGKLLGA